DRVGPSAALNLTRLPKNSMTFLYSPKRVEGVLSEVRLGHHEDDVGASPASSAGSSRSRFCT
ncbi:MAG: hypothetical protein M3441_23970, partial [Chloroflexota bacterium]|nr:hypothetical protein [Chloroflexota bacterium]